MELGIDTPFERPALLRECLRPAAIWTGLSSFFAGTLFLGATLAARQSSNAEAFTGPVLLLLGVALVGVGFTMEPTELRPDPELEFSGQQRYLVAGVSGLFLMFVAAVLVLSVI